jgi:hypothetical protein
MRQRDVRLASKRTPSTVTVIKHATKEDGLMEKRLTSELLCYLIFTASFFHLETTCSRPLLWIETDWLGTSESNEKD